MSRDSERASSVGAGRSFPRRARTFVSTVVGAATIVTLVGPGAGATNFSGSSGGTGCYANNMQDSSLMTYYKQSLTTKMSNAVTDTVTNDVGPTTMSSSLLTSSNSATDVIYNDGDYSTYCGFDWHPDDASDGFVIGIATCQSLAGTDCEQFHVYFDTSFTDNINDDFARTLACHETGHTVGLLHRESTGCMPANVPSNAHFFNTHDRTEHINVNY